MKKILVIVILFIFSGGVNANSCLTNWNETKQQIDRLRKIAECPQFSSINDCKLNSGYVSDMTRMAMGVGAILGSKMSYIRMKCGGVAENKTSDAIYESAVAALFYNYAHASGGCMRAYEGFIQEARWTHMQAQLAVDSAYRTKAIELWAQQNRVSPGDLAKLYEQFTEKKRTFGAFQAGSASKNPTYFTHMESVQIKTGSAQAVEKISDVRLRTMAREFVQIQSGMVHGKLAMAPELKAIQEAAKGLVGPGERIAGAARPGGFTSASGAAKYAEDGLKMLHSAMLKIKAISPNDLMTQHVTDLADGLKNAVWNGKVCALEQPKSFAAFVAEQLIPYSHAAAICSVNSAARSAATQIESQAARRLMLGRALGVIGWVTLGYELSAMGYDMANPCPPTESKYLFPTSRSMINSCKPKMSLDTLANPVGFYRDAEKKKYANEVSFSFFDLTEDQQKAEFAKAEFCEQFSDVFESRLNNKKVTCDGNELYVGDAKAATTYKVTLKDGDKIQQITAFGSGIPNGSSIYDFDDDQKVTSMSFYPETRGDPTQTGTAATKYSVESLNSGSAIMKNNARENLSALYKDMGAILEKQACCSGELTDPNGACKNVTFKKPMLARSLNGGKQVMLGESITTNLPTTPVQDPALKIKK